MDLKSTLHLPDSEATIPMKAGLPTLEPRLLEEWRKGAIYHQIQHARAGKPTFVLHDGPPYTNSPIHMGTAMNKILKDFVVKSRTMMGFQAPYVPGFDNHGLPIEQAVQKKLAEKKVTPNREELLQACREHAQEFVDVQRDQFQRLGVFGLWENPYRTMDFRYEAELIRVFARLVAGGYVYKGLRPTLWSPTSRTALADTEIVYKDDHVSKAIYVAFALRHDPNEILAKFDRVSTIIWTTTPWTIPANLACAFHPELSYAVVRVAERHYVVLDALVERIATQLEWGDHEVVAHFDGINFEGMEFSHPIFDRASIAVMADYVTTEDGTGVVHTAPSHGRDDFFTGQKYGLPVPNTVNERGVLTIEAGEFEGVFYKDCDKVVVERLQEVGALLNVRDYVHSYPYAERDGMPVIFRATEQWFISLENEQLRERMLESISNVQFFPEQGRNRIEAMIRHRPDWCISRQRPWGVGIPVFYTRNSRTPVLDPEAIEAVASLVEEEGLGAWFSREAHEILPAGFTYDGESEFDKETDVLDVWFDSGATSLCVLEGNVYSEWRAPWPADLYLEGSDQHRGWFNTSLILAQACRDEAPYRSVLTHGFVVDGQGRKMSKRLGNVIDPVEASNKYGADILRYWVASVDYSNDVPCTDAILGQCGEEYRNIRNTLRFLLGNLKGFRRENSVSELLPIDEYIVEQAELLADECVQAYERYDFNDVTTSVHNFCRQQLSSFYLDAIKDRMYCDGADWPSRKSGQTACLRVLTILVKLIAPVLAFTAEETWQKLHEVLGEPSATIHAEEFDAPNEERLVAIEASDLQVRFASLLSLREVVNAAFEAYKATGAAKNSQTVIASVTASSDVLEQLRHFSTEDLATWLKVSHISLSEGDGSVQFEPTPYLECKRCRLYRADVEEVELDGERVALSARDRRALGIA